MTPCGRADRFMVLREDMYRKHGFCEHEKVNMYRKCLFCEHMTGQEKK
jgi:hypothetical protein